MGLLSHRMFDWLRLRKETALTWTAEDSRLATLQGWDLFESGGSWRLERNDELEMFTDDAQAWWHVHQRAEWGCPTCNKALEVLRTRAPTEYAYVIQWCNMHGGARA